MGYIAAAVLGLYNTLNGNAIFSAYGTNLQVFCGPPLDHTTPIEVLVGSGGIDDEDDGTSLSQRWATMGAAGRQRDKIIQIPLTVGVIGGEVEMDARLAQADTVWTLIDTLLTTSDLGLGPVLCGGVELRDTGVWLGQTQDAASVVIRSQVTVTAREA